MKSLMMMQNKQIHLGLKTYITSLILLCVITSCNKNDDLEKLWSNDMTFYEYQNYNQCLVSLDNLIEEYPDSDYAPKSYYLISEIYLNEYKQYDIAQEFLKKIINILLIGATKLEMMIFGKFG